MTPISITAENERRAAGWPAQVLILLTAGWAVAAAAQLRIAVPWTPVPITGQTFAVAMLGIVLGPRRAFQAVALYLLQGGLGLPFFAGHTAGPAVLAGPTGGYLLAMPFAAAAAGLIVGTGRSVGALRVVVASLACSAVVLVAGTAWLAHLLHGPLPALWAGLLPFIPGEFLKAGVAATALAGLRHFRRE